MCRSSSFLEACAMLLALAACGARAAAPKPPAVLSAGSDGGGCGHEAANRLAEAGFALRADRAGLSDHPLAWDSLKSYNVVVLAGPGRANTDMSLGRTQQTIDPLNRPELFVQLTQCGDNAWTLELHNPTDAPIVTRVRANPAFDPLRGKALPDGPVTVPAGASVVQRL